MIISDSYEVLLLGLTAISIIFAIYTLFLIFYITPKSMSEYRYFLLLYTSWDLAYTVTLGIVLEPRVFFPGRGAIVQGIARNAYFLVKQYFGPEYAYRAIRIGICTFVWSIVNIIITQDYCLIYRFTVVLPNQRYHDFLVNRKVVYCTIAFGFGICFCFAVPFYLFIVDEDRIPDFINAMEEMHPGTFVDVKPDSICFWFNQDSKDFQGILFGIGGGFIVSEVICYFCVSKILSILKANASSFSARTYKLHRQMTVLLYLQITNPIIFVLFPISTCILAMFFNWKFHHWIGLYGLAFMNCYSISNSILTIIFVTPYRNFTRKYTFDLIMKMPCLKKYQNVIQIAPAVSSSTAFTVNSQNAMNFN